MISAKNRSRREICKTIRNSLSPLMKLSIRKSCFLAILGLSAMGTPALAGPDLYVDSLKVDVSQSECIENFKLDLIRAGFDRDFIVPTTYTNKSGKVIQDGWEAGSSEENITVSVECDSRNGIGAVAVSGSNRASTYKMYVKVFDTIFKK
jgi:hypothetical protein